MKIVFLGDSLTLGTYGVNYVNLVAAALRGHHFINEGINGDTSLNLYRRLDRDVLAHQPDGVFVMVGINDAVSSSEPGSRRYFRLVKGIHGGQITPIAFRENMRAILMALRVAQVQTWVALPPVESRPSVVAALRQMNTSALEVCQELHVPALDLMARMTPETIPDRPPVAAVPGLLRNMIRSLTLNASRYDQLQARGGYTYSFDGTHLTAQGAQQIADAVSQFLRANGVSG
ncbi:MAG: hypothetical protein K8J31_23530 [Anaerolineae bacterium]|nr:hypothetical protein [Anaerolineae bacterium]